MNRNAEAGEQQGSPVNRGPARYLVNQRGVTYLMVMAAVVLMGVSSTIVAKQWAITVKRDKEAELLFRGNRIKNAIQFYAADYEVMKATRANRFPVNLNQLIERPKRYLQEVYKDPITGKEFELIKVGAEIRGVRSRSKGKPLNQVEFKNAATYSQVAFQVESAALQQCLPGVNPLNPLAPSACVPTGLPAGSPSGFTSSNQPGSVLGKPPS